ncbi:MAG TPA: AAA family ATPase, partial [Longimicrobiaceae bacterium]|nr:AAA family ATPase [Longimicrobiaceae bacterium]
MAALSRALETSQAGAGSTVFLLGETGMGKSRLVRAVAREAERRGARVVTGRAYRAESGVRYGLFRDAFPAGAGGDPCSRVPGRLRRLAAERPLLLVLEDLHWADPCSLELLHLLAWGVAGQPVLILCTCDDLHPAGSPAARDTLRSLLAQNAAGSLRLPPLSPAETHEFVCALVSDSPARLRELSGDLHRRTCGIPFLLAELVGGGSGAAWRPGDEPAVTPALREVLLARLEWLSPAARSSAELAAVAGARSEYDALRAASPLAEPELVAALDELRLHRVLVEGAAGDRIWYDFAQPLLREVVLSTLGAERTRLLRSSLRPEPSGMAVL